MPESAETKLTVDFLADNLVGNLLCNWAFKHGKYACNSPSGFDILREELPVTVEHVECKGKFIYMVFSGRTRKVYAMHSLRMTGSWQLSEDKFCKWMLTLGNGCSVWFRDPRMFGTVSFTDEYSELCVKLSTLGPDILREEFTFEVFVEILRKRPRKNICAFLMDQSVISGCGNIIKCESLYYAEISPMRKVGSLTKSEQELLFEALYLIPRIAYIDGGISVKDFQVDGTAGMFQNKLSIYGESSATRTSTPDGRITYWNPNIQK